MPQLWSVRCRTLSQITAELRNHQFEALYSVVNGVTYYRVLWISREILACSRGRRILALVFKRTRTMFLSSPMPYVPG